MHSAMTSLDDAVSDVMLELDLPCRRSTLHLAKRIAKVSVAGDLIVLQGPLGAGKTFFVRGMARELGLPAHEPVTSPTFALVQELPTHPPLVHADLFRLKSAAEVADLGLTAAREQAVVVVEWGETYVREMGGDALLIQLTRSPKRAKLSATGPTAKQRLAQVSALLPLPVPARLRQ